jgi:L-amino acid N-acyltransferase YncA
MLTIRTATPKDAPALLSIYAPYVRDTAVSFETEVPSLAQFEGRITKAVDTWSWIVAEREGQVLGYAYGGMHRERAAYQWVVETSVYIDPCAQGQGLGKALYTELLSRLAERGFCSAMAVVVLPNAASVRLHESMGFRPIGLVERSGWKFGAWHDTAWLQCQLRDAPPPVSAPS